jgi:hypothetical protein
MNLCKGSAGKKLDCYSMLVNLDVNYNPVSKAVVDKLSLGAVKAGRKKNETKIPPSIATVNGKFLCANAVICQMVQICNCAEMK